MNRDFHFTHHQHWLVAGVRTPAFVLLAVLLLSTGCQPVLLPAPATTNPLTVRILFPGDSAALQMGQQTRLIAQVMDAQGAPVEGATVSIIVAGPDGQQLAHLQASGDAQGTYRSDTWTVPHHVVEGVWTLLVEADSAGSHGQQAGEFRVNNSTSETLLAKYGFWLDPPNLRDIHPSICAEQGDAQNGRLCWGGIIPALHILPANWVELEWRAGQFDLSSADAVRRFMLEEIGILGFSPVRELGPFERTTFKQWDAWRVGGRGQFSYEDVEWLIFYAPEVDKTYFIGTTVVLPPAGIDAHAALRASFDVDPAVAANGVASMPLARLLPAPELLDPPMGESFSGLDEPVMLRWQPVKELAPDEYYEVTVEYDYIEGMYTEKLATRETQLALPETFYRTPNCQAFDWHVTLNRQTGVSGEGQPIGEPVSYDSLMRYLIWDYPAGQRPVDWKSCPNAQF